MTWFYATSVSVTNGQTVVSVNTGDDIVIAQEQGGLIIGTNPPVEIKRTYLDGSSNKKIELSKPWPYGSQTNQPAMAFPTDGDLAAATAVLKLLIDGFALATQADAQAGTENTKPMTALRVKQAMDVLLGTASKLNATTSTADGTIGRALRVGDFGVGLSASTDMRVNPVTDGSIAADLNTLIKPGWLKSLINGTISTNAPPLTAGGTGYWYLQVLEYNNGVQVQQRAISYDILAVAGSPPSPPQLFTRTRYEGTWSAWAQASAPVLGQVAFSGSGVNNGAIIERGSNANGEYVKFADGTAFCWNTFEQSGLSVNPAKTGHNNTSLLVDPALPISLIGAVIEAGRCDFRAAGGETVHVISGRDIGGRQVFLNLGTTPGITWPRLDTIGNLVITNATISWSAAGRWRA